MSKHPSPKSHDPKKHQAPVSATNPGDAPPSKEGVTVLGEPMKEGDALIITMGSGVPRASPKSKRQALIAAAAAGDVDAQLQLGDVYREGDRFTPQDYAEAARWYRAAAEQGNADAQNNLGSMYWGGIGVAKDPVEAVAWYRRATEQRNPVAAFNLAEAFFNGVGVAEDAAEGAKWMRQAAEDGYSLAQTDWGMRLRFGHGVAKDLVAAEEFFIRAARLGDIPAMGNLCDIQAELREMALGGNPVAAQCLMTMYRGGLGVPRDRKTSNRWGNLWANIKNAAADSLTERVFDNEGELCFRLWDDFISPAPRDNLYTLEWLYRTGPPSESVLKRLDSHGYAKYKVDRDAGAPSAA